MEPSEERLRTTIRQLRGSASLVPPAEREDVVQEAIARALKRGVSPDAVPYLRTVIRNLVIDRARRIDEYPRGDATAFEDLTRNEAPDPEEALVSAEACEEIRRALDELPDRYREALLAFVEEGRPAKLSERLGLSPNATWTLLSRARQRLRAQLEGVGIVPGVVVLPLWRLRLRLKELATAGAAGAVAAGAALTIAVTTPAPAPTPVGAPPTPVVAQAADVSPTPIATVDVGPVPPPDSSATSVTPKQALEEPESETTFEQEAAVCSPRDDREGTRLGVSFEDTPADSASEEIVNALPQEARDGRADAPTCEEDA